MNEKNQSEKMVTPSSAPEEVAASNNQLEPMSTNEAEEEVKTKSSTWKWLVLIVLLLGIGFIVATSPSLSKYLPQLSSSNTDKSYSDRKIKVEPNIFTPESSSSAEKAVVSYAALTLALPLMVTILTLLTFINMVLFLMMSGKLSSIKDAVNDIYGRISEKDN